MRIFVGTLYTIENEFNETLESIKKQSYKNYQHFIFKNLKNKDAHTILYGAFMKKTEEFDLLIKVDADMVIEDKDLFRKIVRKFKKNEKLKDLEIAVHDFFSNQLIWGMHAYRNTVKWKTNSEDLFVDPYPVNADELLKDNSELAPAAIHCKNPSKFQSFHYGVHKTLKTIQPNKPLRRHRSKYHWDIIKKTHSNYMKTNDIRIGFAILGAEISFRKMLYPVNLDFSDPKLKKKFEKYSNYSNKQIKKKIRYISFRNLAFLPDELQYKFLLKKNRFKYRLSKKLR